MKGWLAFPIQQVGSQPFDRVVRRSTTIRAAARAAATCGPGETIRESQAQLIESTTGTIALTDHTNGSVLAVVTLA